MSSIISEIIDELNVKAEDIKENIESFKEVIEKEIKVQMNNFQGQGERFQSKFNSNVDVANIVDDVKEEVGNVVKDLKVSVDKAYESLKDTLENIK